MGQPDSRTAGFEYGDDGKPYGQQVLGEPLRTVYYVYMTALLAVCFGVPLVSLGVRFLRSTGPQRQQFKWFLYAGLLLLVTSPFAKFELLVLQMLFSVGILFLPAAIAIAILRRHLHRTIDRRFSRMSYDPQQVIRVSRPRSTKRSKSTSCTRRVALAEGVGGGVRRGPPGVGAPVLTSQIAWP
ncbi:MAG: hypothetical protein EHM70_06670 [Chloroflexota bacterium]|nr:MAG: hypothetical protein EHM70_06670 [Chloroflexota bacterium]